MKPTCTVIAVKFMLAKLAIHIPANTDKTAQMTPKKPIDP